MRGKGQIMKKLLLSLVLIISFLSSCKETLSPEFTECPETIAKKALIHAIEYSNADTEYTWGGREPLRSVIKVDCSGLVVNCYRYAVSGTPYSLPFQDATVLTFFSQWSIKTDNPKQGDLIFMGDDINNPTHMGLFFKEEDSHIYFIDSTLKPEDNINGVSERFYSKDDSRFLSFGKVLVVYN